MPLNADGPVCHEPGRALLYEEVLSHFLDVALLGQVERAECRLCRRQVDCVKVKAGVGVCLAQAAITSKRPLKLADGVPPTFDAPTVRGKNAFNNENVILVASAERSLVTTNIAPVGPLPKGVRAVRPTEVKPYEARRDIILDPPPVPYAAVIFAGRAATFPIKLSTFPDIVVINGGDVPVEVDRRRFRAALETARGLGGIDGFENALSLQEAWAARSDIVFWRDPGKAPRKRPVQYAVDAMASSGIPRWVEKMAVLPNRNDPETTYLRGILEQEAAAKAVVGGVAAS